MMQYLISCDMIKYVTVSQLYTHTYTC